MKHNSTHLHGRDYQRPTLGRPSMLAAIAAGVLFCIVLCNCAGRIPIGPVALRSPLIALPKTATINPAATLAPSFSWPDRRPIAALHIANIESRSATNPAGWLFDPTIDVSDTAALRARFMAYADQAIAVMNDMGAVSMIVWESDGARYGIYLGCPDQAKRINPEIAGIVDDFFARFRAAGKIPGVCIRATEFDETIHRLTEAADPYAALLRKATYARQYWKCRVFYVDTNLCAAPGVDPPQYVSLIPSAVFARLHRALPDCLFIPEHEQVWGNGSVDLGYYQATAPYMELRMGETGTPAAVRAAVPGAFSVLNVSEGDTHNNLAALTAAVRAGDILLCNGWWSAPEIVDVKAAYAGAMESRPHSSARRSTSRYLWN